ncbi:hypothetical protein FA09DRAFT_341140 [Tilletiopsis washingtonensis]|uniref:Uncharacterized protein n=1 Tax=Tilletiopsis washingtonensis TaxID=58919 RepID=A0A316Z2A1_9BASI|nr:hypothetical protein FA09DRAFT_341140 [Tilletiopsis washingtonensis]PWN95496.1 hypothetical protein FA09DRAFT_341140 [Tilletiopsis washingtonensis]
MFGAPQAPPSALELAAARQQAHGTIKTFATYAAGLYAAPYLFHYLGQLLA